MHVPHARHPPLPAAPAAARRARPPLPAAPRAPAAPARTRRSRSPLCPGRFYYRFPNGEAGTDVFDRTASFITYLFRTMSGTGYFAG